MHIITNVFEEKWMLRLQDKKSGTPRMLIITCIFDDVDDNNGRREMAQFENVNISKDV